MTLQRVKIPSFGIGEELTSAQASVIDANIEGALDKRSGETDTLESVVSCSGAGRIRKSTVNGADATNDRVVAC